MDKRLVPAIFFLLLITFGTQLVLSTLDKSIISDEPAHAIRGYYLLKTGNLLIYGHTPLSHFLTVPFLTFEEIKLPSNHEELYLKNYPTTLGEAILFKSGNNADRIIFLARLPILIISVIFGIFIFKLAKELYGVKAGLFALFLYSFNPVVLSIGGVITTDMAASFFIFLAVYAYWNMLKKMTKWRVLLAGLFFALAISTRLTAFALIPIFVILGAGYYYEKRKKPELKRLLLGFVTIMLIGYLMINALYGFEGSFKPLGKNIQDDTALYVDKDKYNAETISAMAPLMKGAVKFAVNRIPVMVPYPFLKDVFSVPAVAFTGKSMFYVLGKFSTWFWYYYPVTFLVKMHLLILAALALSIAFFKKIRAGMSAELMLILPFTFLFLFFMFFIPIENGIRYLLPALPFLFVFVSKVVKLRSKIVAVVLALLSISYVVAALTIFPAYSAYFNEFAGGPNTGYKVTAGSNVELGGEHMVRLKNYMDEKGIEKIKLSYGGGSDPDYYGISRNDLQSIYLTYQTNITEDCGPTTGIIAVSSSNLIGLHMENQSCFSWLNDYEPIDKIGYSLFVYNITEK